MISTIPRLVGCAAALAVALGVLGGCGTRTVASDSFLGVITPYRIDVLQGNALTREAVTLVRPGMTRAQVREVLGSPMLTDPFHRDRWDYLFTIRRPGTPAQRLSVVILFEGDAVKSVQAPANLPTENEFVASIVPPARAGSVPVLELTEAQRRALPVPPRQETAAPAPTAPVRSYPPLERP